MVERKVFLQIQSINIVNPNVENMIVVPITKRMEIIMSIQDCLIHGRTLVTRKMVERTTFITNPKHEYHVSH